MSRLREAVTPNCEKKFVPKCLENNCRLDGRAFDEYRPLIIEFGKDWGCCQVSLGKTRVLAQVSCEIQVPKSSRPSEGLLNINLELTPMAAPHFEAGRPSEQSVQLNRLLEKSIKDSKAVDLESLCIKVNEKVWALRIDVNVLNHEGNILDCASMATIAALGHFRRPDVTCNGEEIIVHTYEQRDPIPTVIHHFPASITYAIFNNGEFVVADPSLQEENAADATISIALNAYKELCSLHLGGKALMLPEVILQTTHKAIKHSLVIINQIKEAIEEDVNKRMKRTNIGFHKSILFENDSPALNNLNQYLDSWKTAENKNKHNKKMKTETPQTKPEMETEKNVKVAVKSIGKNSAEVVEEKNGQKVWDVSSDSDDNEETTNAVQSTQSEKMDVSSQPIQINDDDDDSEEEQTIVINKTTKKKK